MTQRAFVVFSGSNDRAILAFLRALHLCNEKAYIVARTNEDHILRTAYAKDVAFVRPDASLDMGAFADCIRNTRLTAGDQELVVLPSSEYFNAFLLAHRSEIEALGCSVPLVDIERYRQLTNKGTATEVFKTFGVRVPRDFSSPSKDQLPLVAKPRCNINAQGRSLYPHFLRTSAEIDTFLAKHSETDYFFQEHVSGESLYLLFHLAKSGAESVLWSQQNLIQQASGKSMLLAVPDQLHLSAAAADIVGQLEKMKFHGLGMIEFIRVNGALCFIEMNPRIWGPIQFCLDHGQPILESFIGDALYDEPSRFLQRNGGKSVRTTYIWLGGLLDALISGKGTTQHPTTLRPITLILKGIRNDIYLRKDSWRCFFYELALSAGRRLNREHP